VKCSYEEAVVATDALRSARDANGGRIPQAELQQFADFAGVSRRTAYLWIRNGPPTGRRQRFELSERARAALVQTHGNRALAWQILKDEGEELPTKRTFRNAVKREMTPVELAAIQGGEEALVEMRMYSRSEPTVRNELWQCDTVDLDLVALERPGRKTRRRPKVTLVIDDSTGAIMGWSMSFSDTKASVLIALRDAMIVRPEMGPFGGIPERMIVDRGPNMISNAVTDAAVLVGFGVEPLQGGAPWLKGKVESTVQAVNLNFAVRFQHYTGGRQDRRGRPSIPRSDPPSLDLLRKEFAAWAMWRNKSHPIERECDMRTPLERWTAQDDVPLRPISARAAASLLKERVTRAVGKQGIRLQNVRYVSDEMPRYRGQTVEIAYMPRDRRTIDVFIEGEWKFSAHPLNSLSPQELETYRKACGEAVRDARRQVSHLRRASKAQIAPITGSGEPVEDTGVVARDKLRLVGSDARHSDARDAAKARNRLAGTTNLRNRPLKVPGR
jgi:putative transposase